MTHNADIVTARTRLRRLLSLRNTPSFKNTSIRNAFSSVKFKKRRPLDAVEKQNKILVSTIKRSISVSKPEHKLQNKNFIYGIISTKKFYSYMISYMVLILENFHQMKLLK